MRGVPVKTYDKMHAKVCISSHTVIIGSANISANGLGFDNVIETKGNVEASVLVTDRTFSRHVREWFKDLWERSEVISPAHIESARNQWKKT